jgi:hypothetical protein
MNGPLVNESYLKFRVWLDGAIQIDPFDFADWIRANADRLNADLEEGLTHDEVDVWLREMYVSEKRINEYPKAEYHHGC